MRDFFNSVLDLFFAVLEFLHGIFEPIFGAHAWGWAIIGLTLIVRILLLPLAIKQTRSMRAMQAIQPQIKELQKKYKVDRELMKKDPETYRARRQKLSEEQMALFKEEGANPAASCLPLLAQAPIFIALFWMLRGQSDPGDVLFEAPFYFFTSFVSAPDPTDPTGLAAIVSAAGWPGWLLILLMSGSMFITQKQMLARSAAMGSANPMAQQQKILMYVMPVFLAVISFQFPLGILLYWVTTNVWQIAQQAIILREVKHEAESGEIADKPGGSAAGKRKPHGDQSPRRSPGASSGQRKVDAGDDDSSAGAGTSKGKGSGKTSGKGSGKASAKDPGKGGSSAKDGSSKGGSAKGSDGKSGGAKGKAKGDGGANGAEPDVGATSPPAGADGNGAATGRSGAAGDGTDDKPRKRDHLPRRRGGAGS